MIKYLSKTLIYLCISTYKYEILQCFNKILTNCNNKYLRNIKQTLKYKLKIINLTILI